VPAQSVFCRQLEHCSCAVQNGVGAVQSTLDLQATHSALAVSQIGSSPEQPAFDVQPARQRWLPAQMGVAPPQSSLLMHWTHSPVARQMGALAAQSVFARQVTQLPVCASHKAVGAAQSSFVRHSAHAPVVASHFEASRGQAVGVVPVHEAWHW
jgi:hypothetical protein